MKRSGRILLCLACGMALSAVAQANSPSPMDPNANAKQNAGMASKIEALKKRLHAKNLGSGIPAPGGPPPRVFPPGVPNAVPSNHPQPSSISKDNSQDTPYASIATRNVFGLNPPTPPVVDIPQGPPPPKITLTGITTILGPTEALYKVSGVPQIGKPPKDESYILQEGQGQDDVVVVHIDMAKGIVTFNNHGEVQEIPLAAGVASGGSAGGGGGGGFQQPQPGFGGRQGYNNSLQNFRQHMQEQRMGNQNQNGVNPAGQSSYNGGYNNGYNNSDNQNNSTPQLSADDTAALIAAQHAQLQSQGNPLANLFPPSKYDPDANQEVGVDPTAGSTPSTIPPTSRGANGLFRSSGTTAATPP